MANTQASIDILITVRYTKVANQKEKFKEFLLNEGIEFRKGTKDKDHSVSSYLSNLDRFSKTLAKESGTKDFDLLCFDGTNADIDRIFEYGKKFFKDKPSFIKDCRSAINQYKKFNKQNKE